jgi:hypothetical protein
MKMLDINEMEVLKLIRVQENSSWNYFAGNLYYTRKMTKEYQADSPDFIDEMIMSTIKEVYPDSRLVQNKNIMWENQMDDILQSYLGETDVEFKMTFMPTIPYDRIRELDSNDMKSHTKEFNISRVSLNDIEKLKYMNNHMHAEIPFDKITEFNGLINKIKFKK